MTRRLLPKAATVALAAATLFTGEVAFDTTQNRLVLGDGLTAGGKAVAFLSDVPTFKQNVGAGNFIMATTAPLLTNSTAGTKNGDLNVVIAPGGMTLATTAYANTGVGYGVFSILTTGHSNTAYGYQAGHKLVGGYMNTLIGLDPAYLCEEIRWSTIVGHHNVNTINGPHQGLSILGQQVMRYLPAAGIQYQSALGRNIQANAHNLAAYPTWGDSGWSDLIGGTAMISASALRSQALGFGIVQQNNAAVTDASLAGYFNHYGFTTVTGTASWGAYGFFITIGDGAGRTSAYNTGAGYEHGYNVYGQNNVFQGRRAGWHASATSVNGAVAIGPYAGFNRLTNGDLYIAGADTDGATLIWGNFLSQVLKLRANHLQLVDLPAAADDAAAASAGVAVGEWYRDTADNKLTMRAA